MKIAAIPLALSLLLAQTKAAPASSNLEARQASTPDIVFQGAADANFTLSGVPQDNTIFSISTCFRSRNAHPLPACSRLAYTTTHTHLYTCRDPLIHSPQPILSASPISSSTLGPSAFSTVPMAALPLP